MKIFTYTAEDHTASFYTAKHEAHRCLHILQRAGETSLSLGDIEERDAVELLDQYAESLSEEKRRRETAEAKLADMEQSLNWLRRKTAKALFDAECSKERPDLSSDLDPSDKFRIHLVDHGIVWSGSDHCKADRYLHRLKDFILRGAYPEFNGGVVELQVVCVADDAPRDARGQVLRNEPGVFTTRVESKWYACDARDAYEETAEIPYEETPLPIPFFDGD